MPTVGGLVKFSVDGEIYRVRGNATYGLGGDRAESSFGADGFHGVMEKPEAAFIEVTLVDVDGTVDVQRLKAKRNATVMLELKTGKSVGLRQAAQVGPCTANAEDGGIEVRFEGPIGNELT